MENFNDKTYMNLSKCYLDRYIGKFIQLFNKNRVKNQFKKDCLSNVNYKLTFFQNRNTQQTRILLFADKLFKTGEGLTPGDAIKIYCNTIDKMVLPNTSILAHIRALYKFRDYLFRFKIKNTKSKSLIKSANQLKNKTSAKLITDSLKLSDLIIDTSKFKYVMAKLVFYGFCSEQTYKWIPQGKGNKQKLCTLLYSLFSKGYFNISTIPSISLLRGVAKNTFGVDISPGTFKNKKRFKFQKDFDFIRFSNQIS